MGVIKIDSVTVAVAPDGIAEITKEVGVPHQAIMSPTPLQIYYSPAASSEFLTWPANVPLGVEPELRLVDTTDCFFYGVRSV